LQQKAKVEIEDDDEDDDSVKDEIDEEELQNFTKLRKISKIIKDRKLK
jgi:hypothetical protein